MDKFWNCDSNKVALQRLMRETILHRFREFSNSEVVVGGVIENNVSLPAQRLSGDTAISEITALQIGIEEADMRIIPHIDWILSQTSTENIVVISNDTDVLALLLFYRVFQ